MATTLQVCSMPPRSPRFSPATSAPPAPTVSAADGRVAWLGELAEPQRAAALARFKLLQPHLEDGIPLVQVAAAAGVPVRTAQRWLARYRADDLTGLARQPRRDRGRRRLPEQLQLLIEGLALRRPAPTIAAVHRLAADVARSRGWPVPSYGRVYDLVRSLDPALVTLAQEGTKRYREVFDLIHRRDAEGPTRSGRPTTPSSTCGCATRPASPHARG